MARTAFVTGAGARVGRAVAVELAANGFALALHYRSSREGVDETAARCAEHGAQTLIVQGDLARVEDCTRLCAEVGERFPALHLLVNNASLFHPVPFAEIGVAAWDEMQAVNVRAPFLLSQGLLPALRAAGEGLVVHLCDIGAERPVRGYAHYSVSKAALVMLVKAMAVELAPQVRTVGISPGHVVWPPAYGAEVRERLARRIPMKRVGEAEDVARLVRFLALEAPYVNGAIVPVDGGLGVRY